jgi:hypothetical protein
MIQEKPAQEKRRKKKKMRNILDVRCNFEQPSRPRFKRTASQAPVAQLDRASDYGSEGLGFKSLRVRHFKKWQRRLAKGQEV